MKKICVLSALFAILFNTTPVLANNNIPLSASSIEPRSDILEWKYKIENGKMYKRLYNKTKEIWVGDWILM